jgi:hypothetical protein
MIAKLTKYPSQAYAFLEYVEMSDSFEKEVAVQEALREYAVDISFFCSADTIKKFKRLVESPCTVGGHESYEALKAMTPPIPHWQEIEAAMAPLLESYEERPAFGTMYPGCRSLKHSRAMYQLSEYSPDVVAKRWLDWNAILYQADMRTKRSLEAKKMFKNGDRVMFTDGSWKGRYGILQDVERDFHQCTVQEVTVDRDGKPLWVTKDGGSRLCGFYQELVLVHK